MRIINLTLLFCLLPYAVIAQNDEEEKEVECNLELQTSVENVTCNGEATGSASIEVKGGTAPFSYSIDGINFQPLEIFDNILAGEYNVMVYDANKCYAETMVEIQEPEPITVFIGDEITVNSGETVELDAGAGFDRYLWSNGETSQKISVTYSNNTAGEYVFSVTVYNEEQCSGASNELKLTVVPFEEDQEESPEPEEEEGNTVE